MRRRTFLKAGVAGTVLLAGAARIPAAAARAADSMAARGLSSADRVVVAAIAPVMLAGALPAGEAKAKAVASVVDGVSQAVAGMPPATRRELGELFMLLDLAPTRRLVAGVSRPWPEASVGEIAAFLQAWRMSRLALLQSGYHALHDLIVAAWYAQPESWPPLAYPGPPEV
ncbi:MAG: hypothetical protein N2544_09400 [Burkholderiales bacterium]|nr:hypothetical protein [Burkholderiales bacterium]